MTSISVSDLENRIRELVLQVQEKGETVEIVDQGKVIARIVPEPVSAPEVGPQSRQWTELDELIADIRPLLPASVDAVEAIRDVRR